MNEGNFDWPTTNRMFPDLFTLQTEQKQTLRDLIKQSGGGN